MTTTTNNRTADKLSRRKCDTELTEEQLEKVSGGTISLAYEEVKFEYGQQHPAGGTAAPRRISNPRTRAGL